MTRPANNPFFPVPAAPATVRTEGIRDALSVLADYLAMPTRIDHGNVLAISGEPGVGKTHLINMLFADLQSVPRHDIISLWVDSPGTSFLDMYRRIMSQLDRQEFRRCVRTLYAGMVTDSLDPDALGSGVLPELLSGGVGDLGTIMETFGLSTSSLLIEFQQLLHRLTDDTEFSVAVPLLLRNGFDTAIWSWLHGDRPSKILADRGVSSAIDNDVAALRAIGSVIALCGRSGRRLVLAVDDLDTVLLSRDAIPPPTQIAFWRLLQSFTAANGLLVLSGLPRFLNALPPKTRDRLGNVLTLTGFDSGHAAELIGTVVGSFRPEDVAYITAVTGGNPRRIIKLCHALRRSASTSGAPVTRDAIRCTAREKFTVVSPDDVHRTIQRMLTRDHWGYLRNYVLDETNSARVDYWVTGKGDKADCVVLILDSVLDDEDVDVLSTRVNLIRSVRPSIEIITVINGHISSTTADKVANLGVRCLRYDDDLFPETLHAALQALTK